MGATNKIKETNIGQALIGKECDGCKKKISNKDVLNYNNWAVDFDTSNDVKLEDNKIKGYGYNLTIWIRNIYHFSCEDAEDDDQIISSNVLGEEKELNKETKNHEKKNS